jgi:hypothetical protein
VLDNFLKKVDSCHRIFLVEVEFRFQQLFLVVFTFVGLVSKIFQDLVFPNISISEPKKIRNPYPLAQSKDRGACQLVLRQHNISAAELFPWWKRKSQE